MGGEGNVLLNSALGVQWEQKWLAQQVKWDFTADEREEMFLTWNIHKESKQRKLQLIKCLWSAKTLRYLPVCHHCGAMTVELS